MSNQQQPRPLPKQIYRRRQIGCLGVIVVLIGLIWLLVNLVSGLSGSTSNPGAGSTNPASTAAAGDPCAPGAVVVAPIITDSTLKGSRANFAAGEKPYFGFTLTNNGSVDCSFNVGSAEQFFTVTSGSDTYWSSADCDRTGTVDKQMVIKAGESISSQPTVWDRVRSSKTGCSAASGQLEVPAGGATFHLNVSVAGVLSDPARGAFILN